MSKLIFREAANDFLVPLLMGLLILRSTVTAGILRRGIAGTYPMSKLG